MVWVCLLYFFGCTGLRCGIQALWSWSTDLAAPQNVGILISQPGIEPATLHSKVDSCPPDPQGSPRVCVLEIVPVHTS